MTYFSYFAYGSNMLVERLRVEDRCPSARVIGPAIAQDFEVSFAKQSKDGSGKATLVHGITAIAHGVLFAVDESERNQLERTEGAGIGYHSVDEFPVFDVREEMLRPAMTFFAASAYIDLKLRPFDWYHALVLAGAKQNGLPSDHLQLLLDVGTIADPIATRPTRIEALKVLRQAGFEGPLG